jgi:O-acetyl-ADP-ribose deacetylase (regulator of RNase III)
MKIEYRTGNLFLDTNIAYIVHCVNAQHRMKSGFAKELRERYPDAYDTYMAEPVLRMGDIIPHVAPDSRTIFHLVGQQHYGNDGERYVSYDAITEGIVTLNKIAPEIRMTELAMPLIGAGLAGGSWSVISEIIQHYSVDFQPIVYLLDGKIPE